MGTNPGSQGKHLQAAFVYTYKDKVLSLFSNQQSDYTCWFPVFVYEEKFLVMSQLIKVFTVMTLI